MGQPNEVKSDESTEISPIGELIHLFSEHLADIEFPDVNASSLSELACKLEAARGAIEELEHQLLSAHNVHHELESELQRKSQSALGYAKVYADGNEELSTALSAIVLGKKRRVETRPRKTRRKATNTSQKDLPLEKQSA